MGNIGDLTGKRVLVTGASSGIGRAAAVLISELGATVIAVGRNESRLEETRDSLTGEGHQISVFDLAQADLIPKWMQEIASEGRLDGLVHMAGIHGAKPLRISDVEFVNNLLEVNVGAALQLARGFRHKKVRATTSSIVLASSIAAMIGEPGISAYSATKGAIISICQSLASELSSEGIRVNCISPSVVKTELTIEFFNSLTPEHLSMLEKNHPLGFGEPEDIAPLIAFLISDSSRWMTGSNVVIDGGYSTK